ncbi:MAG: CpsD/CapB family tyrosine-protein kinase [Gammaproteobacteria bacterium]
MEKIKQALDKARQERQQAGPHAAKSAVKAFTDVSSIHYTQTQSVEGSQQKMRESRLLSSMGHSEYTDAMKILSTQVLQRMKENHWGSIAVTSARKAEGKTTIALNLGISIAREVEYTVLVVDANMRHPNVHQYFGINPQHGLSDYLTNDDIELSELLINPKGLDHFVILPAGNPHHSSSELLSSPKMCTLVQELTNRYAKRIIIFDLPPVLETADALAFVPCIDTALVVVEDDVTKESDLQEAIDMLCVTDIIGTVLNKSMY